jgi:hypothetical protein
MPVAVRRQPVMTKSANVFAAKPVASFRWSIEKAQDIHQR